MIGFSLSITELNGAALTEDLLERASQLDYGRDVDLLRSELSGESLFYTGSLRPWGELLELRRSIEAGSAPGRLIYNNGYPYLFTARGREINSELIAHEPDRPPLFGASLQKLEGTLDPESLYLLEAWDQS